MQRIILTALSLSALATPVFGQDRVAAGVGVGTTGLHVEGQFQVSERLVLRGAYETLNYERDQDIDDINYSGEIDSSVFGAFVQYHPAASAWFVTGGALLGGRELGLDAEPTTSVTVGDTIFTPDQVGRLEGEADLGGFAPVLGAGWDNTFQGTGFGFRVMAGVAFGQEPDVSLTSVGGSLSSDPVLQAELQEEEARLREDSEALRYYPILQVALTYRF